MLRRKFQSHPVGVKILGFLIGAIFRLWMRTLDYRFVMRAGASNPPWAEKPMLYVFWHEMLLFPAYTHSRFNVATLVSRHRDGELLAEVLRMLRGKVVRGSTSRNGVPGLRSMIRRGRISHLAIAPDGPLGPRRVFQAGAIFLASRAQIPIVPAGFAFDRYWRANSWDRTVLPRPFARAFCVFESPSKIPPDADRDQIEEYRCKLQLVLEDVQKQAEQLVAGAPCDLPIMTLSQVRTR